MRSLMRSTDRWSGASLGERWVLPPSSFVFVVFCSLLPESRLFLLRYFFVITKLPMESAAPDDAARRLRRRIRR